MFDRTVLPPDRAIAGPCEFGGQPPVQVGLRHPIEEDEARVLPQSVAQQADRPPCPPGFAQPSRLEDAHRNTEALDLGHEWATLEKDDLRLDDGRIEMLQKRE